MNIRSVDLNLLAVFDALFDERNVSKAAKRLALTQPTVSGMLKRLRLMFDDDLFVRTSHGVVPTPRAETLAAPVKDLLQRAQSLVRPVAFDPGESETTFRVCGSDYLQLAVISPLIRRLKELAPKTRVSVLPRPGVGLADLLARGEIDLSVNVRDVAIEDFPARRLFTDRYVCVARKAHPLDGDISLNELCSFEHLLVDPTQGRFDGPMDATLAEHGVRRRVTVVVPSFAMLFETLTSGDYLSFMPERLFLDRVDTLKMLSVDIGARPIEVLANWHPRVTGDARHRWLRGQLVDLTRR